mmetsp:Transcript_9058/g.31185  ORF Transcript_9058/g.31185 Transcript_9058/m.31185 type:complete len:657 (-) Transcript_9058:222-2192(-)
MRHEADAHCGHDPGHGALRRHGLPQDSPSALPHPNRRRTLRAAGPRHRVDHAALRRHQPADAHGPRGGLDPRRHPRRRRRWRPARSVTMDARLHRLGAPLPRHRRLAPGQDSFRGLEEGRRRRRRADRRRRKGRWTVGAAAAVAQGPRRQLYDVRQRRGHFGVHLFVVCHLGPTIRPHDKARLVVHRPRRFQPDLFAPVCAEAPFKAEVGRVARLRVHFRSPCGHQRRRRPIHRRGRRVALALRRRQHADVLHRLARTRVLQLPLGQAGSAVVEPGTFGRFDPRRVQHRQRRRAAHFAGSVFPKRRRRRPLRPRGALRRLGSRREPGPLLPSARHRNRLKRQGRPGTPGSLPRSNDAVKIIIRQDARHDPWIASCPGADLKGPWIGATSPSEAQAHVVRWAVALVDEDAVRIVAARGGVRGYGRRLARPQAGHEQRGDGLGRAGLRPARRALCRELRKLDRGAAVEGADRVAERLCDLDVLGAGFEAFEYVVGRHRRPVKGVDRLPPKVRQHGRLHDAAKPRVHRDFDGEAHGQKLNVLPRRDEAVRGAAPHLDVDKCQRLPSLDVARFNAQRRAGRQLWRVGGDARRELDAHAGPAGAVVARDAGIRGDLVEDRYKRAERRLAVAARAPRRQRRPDARRAALAVPLDGAAALVVV